MEPQYPAAVAYAAAAVVSASLAMLIWRRRDHRPTFAVSLTLVMAGACWWSVADAVSVAFADRTPHAIALLAIFPGPSVLSAAFMCAAFAISHPQWVPRRALVLALAVEPVVNTLLGATNPWHLLQYRGPGAAQLTGPASWTIGPFYVLDNWYCYPEMALGVVLVAWGWWKAPQAFRRQRLALLLAALIPLAANVVFISGGFGDVLDPTALGFVATGTIMSYAIFRQDLFTFAPVARALIIDQIGDAVVVIGAGGQILDLNAAAVSLVRGLRPGAPADLVGASAQDLFGADLTGGEDRQSDLVVEQSAGRTEFEVRASRLVDRRHQILGSVLVARDVTEANAQSRRLTAAHSQLIRQVETINGLRADLVELATRDALTGLHNRRHMVERFTSMLAAAQRRGEPLAVALFDVDRFKSVNDECGHLAGDAVLVALSRRIQQRTPPNALVARWGGEEFFVALPGAGAATGLAFAQDVLRECAQDPIDAGGRMIHCTVSAGVAVYPTSGTTQHDLFHAADVSLYEAKNAGRNRVHLYRDPAPAAVDAGGG